MHNLTELSTHIMANNVWWFVICMAMYMSGIVWIFKDE